MSKVTSKLQVTVPKVIAEKYGIRPGDELDWLPTPEGVRVVPARAGGVSGHALTLEERLAFFDQDTANLDSIQAVALRQAAESRKGPKDRGWTREELYTRGFPR
jgi:AbrB family looped-hinge helix DNA binding protein